MTFFQRPASNTPFSTEHACVTYLFQKRWPWGFKCPFCQRVQKDMAPAYTVVCRYCRKQTSITAHTLMHGSKKNLVAWMRVASQFCFHEQGISARELQRLMELSCYQTAWSWLQKIRHGAALAESAPCRDTVLFDVNPLRIAAAGEKKTRQIAMALEMEHAKAESIRVRLLMLDSTSPEEVTAAIESLVQQDTSLLLPDHLHMQVAALDRQYQLATPTAEQLAGGQLLLLETTSWLDRLYCGAIDSCYLQSYLDEFCFRHNTVSWPDRLAVLDHLLSGLISPADDMTKTNHSPSRGQ
jgi:hypothetical protein